MNESDYFNLAQPQVLLERTTYWGHSIGPARRFPPPSERELRLIACACFRYLRDELGADVSLKDVEVAERFSEGDPKATRPSPPLAVALYPGRLAAITALRTATAASRATHLARLAATFGERIAPALRQAELSATTGAALERAHKAVARHFRAADAAEVERLVAEDRRRLCDLIRDVLGNLYRPAVVRPAWLDANRRLARTIAGEIEATNRFADVPILADALEEAGCDDADVLAHARQPRHYRGCWLIDAIVGKA